MAFPILAQAIRHILLEHGEVKLPRLGRLHLVYQPARLDRLGAKIGPPEKKPVFSPDPELNEEQPALLQAWHRFAGDTALAGGLSAETELHALGSQVMMGEETELADVGRFKPQDQGPPRFEPAGFNYHLDVFGLGPVPAQPLRRRSATQAATEALAAREAMPRRMPPAEVRRSADRWFLPVMSALLLMTIGVALWLLLRPSPPELPPLLVDEEEDQAMVYLDEEALRIGSDTMDLEAIADPEEEEDMADLQPAQINEREDPAKWVTIVVGHFGDPANAERVLQRLEEMGLQGESLPRKELTRVVVNVNPARQDPEEVLSRVQQSFDKGAWIVR